VCDIFILTETNLTNDINHSELVLPHYNIFRKDRDPNTSVKRSGGGVMIITKNSVKASQIETENANVEQLFLSFNTANNNVLIVGVVYIPPRSSIEVYQSHCDTVENVMHRYPNCNQFILFGDYNIPSASWCDGLLHDSNDSICSMIGESFAFCDLYQCNTVSNHRGVLLDLVFSSRQDQLIIPATESLLPIDIHHPPISTRLSLKTNTANIIDCLSMYDFKKCDFLSISSHLEVINWAELLCPLSVNEGMSLFYSILNELICCFTPVIQVKVSNYPKWFSNELRNFIKLKKIAHKSYKSTGDLEYYIEFCDLRRRCKQMTKNCYLNYINSTQENISCNTKYFWSHVNNLRRSHRLPTDMFLGDQRAYHTQDICNLFATHFSSVYSYDQPSCPVLPDFPNSVHISSLSISTKDLLFKLKSVDTSKGLGPDNISPLLVKYCCESLLYPLYILFNKSLSSGIYPESFKSGYVIPIHKDGNKKDVINYRPIVMQSVLAKILESLVTDKLSATLGCVLMDEQHGFRSGRSTCTNLLVFQHDITQMLSLNTQVDVIYCDFKKAFDKVLHPLLLTKIRAYGIAGSIYNWFQSYLLNRKLMVKISGFKSFSFCAPSGVPQGSHLGPLLFLLFVNDIGSYMHQVKYLLYADDLKIYYQVNERRDTSVLTVSLNNLVKWCNSNHMELNLKKCYTMSISKSNSRIEFNYSISDHTLVRVDCFQDLGVIFDSRLSFAPHIEHITLKAYRMLGFVGRTCKDFNDINCFRLLYLALVRPILEYCSIIWSPYYIKYVQIIEKVQHKFLRIIAYKFHLNGINGDLNELMECINLTSLHLRRKQSAIIFLYCILNNHVNSSTLLSLVSLRVPSISSRSTSLFTIPFLRNNYSFFLPLFRAMRDSNANSNLDFFATPLHVFKTIVKSSVR
jgi:hypothetical protein